MIEISYGEDPYQDRSELRADIWNIAQGRCEHPIFGQYTFGTRRSECGMPATELAHIQPRGMGHQGDRDTINNTIAACPIHARSTDNLSDPEWEHVPEPHDRIALTAWTRDRRRAQGWAL